MEKEHLGNYILSEKIGTGGMAEVFLAHHKNNSNKPFALKRMLTKFSEDKSLVNMFIQEASLASILNHPNIIPIYDFGVIDNQYFLAMEYLEGKDLKSILRASIIQKKTLPFAISSHIACQALHALHYAHNKCDHYQRPLEIVHRDISPQNIMISFEGSVKILDFGIAKAIAKPGDSEKGMLKGKFSYMSPEQATGKAVDPRSDVFAVGIVLWELLTLHSCYTANDSLELIKKVRQAKIIPPHVINPKVPQDLSNIVMKSLEKNLNNRYQSALEFGQDLENYILDRHGSINHADMISFLGTVFYEPRISETLNQAMQNDEPYLSFDAFSSNETGQFDKAKHTQSKKLKKLAPWQIGPSAAKKYILPFCIALFYAFSISLIYSSQDSIIHKIKNPPSFIQSIAQAIGSFFINKNSDALPIKSMISTLPIIKKTKTFKFSDPIQQTVSTLRNKNVLSLGHTLYRISKQPERYFNDKGTYNFSSERYDIELFQSNETQQLNIIKIQKKL